jgi:hypothetical protein
MRQTLFELFVVVGIPLMIVVLFIYLLRWWLAIP